MNKQQKERLDEIKSDLARLSNYKNRCFVCHIKKSKKGMVFHHLWYEVNELIYKDFANALDYYIYLKDKIKQNPKRFLYVCNSHHQSIERLKRFSNQKQKRLFRAVKMSN